MTTQNKQSSIKLLLMGRRDAGKTSMHSIIFANLPAQAATNTPWTRDVDEQQIKFLGMNLQINDCGGQELLWDAYFNSYPEKIFSGVRVLIYVFDLTVLDEASLKQFNKAVDFLYKYSPEAKVFVLVHKMDMAQNKDLAFADAKAEINKCENAKNVVGFFPTSIWDVSLYQAWSQIVQIIIPDLGIVNQRLQTFCETTEVDEIILFEKSTFLIISWCKLKKEGKDLKKDDDSRKNILKYERISTIMKQFKISCNKVGSEISMLSIQNPTFKAVIDEFTCNTFILLVTLNPHIKCPALHFNIKCARAFFKNDDATQEVNNLLSLGL